MGQSPPRNLTKLEQQRLNRWPCDGKARFQIRESGRKTAYGEAYDTILKVTGSVMNPEGMLVFTTTGRKRITALNKLYFPLAKDFIGVALWRMEQEQKRQEEAKKIKESEHRVASVEPNPTMQ